MQKWEYSIIFANDVELFTNLADAEGQKFLNQYGQHGWELVSVSTHKSEAPTNPPINTSKTVFYFKRPV